MSETEMHLKYIREYLVTEIVSKLPKDEVLESYKAGHNASLDGFMSVFYNITLKTKNVANGIIKERNLIAKLMKGDVHFRQLNKADAQYANEILVYKTVLPEYEKLLTDFKVDTHSVGNLIPTAYLAKYGFIEGLSATASSKESVLVLENLKSCGYKMGPRQYLNKQQLLAMCKPLGEYHAMSFALRLYNPAKFERIKSQILPVPFYDENDSNDPKSNFLRNAYRVAFDRFFDFFDRCIDTNTFDKQCEDDIKLFTRLRYLRTKYFDEPSGLMQQLLTKLMEREEDVYFGTILHGDYSGNNVLFDFASSDAISNTLGTIADVEVERVKMIDFKLMRFGSPALDLSVFAFINLSNVERPKIWKELLRTYHEHMYKTLSNIITAKDGSDKEEILSHYSFEHFNSHFERFALYGVMVSMQFLSWNLCSEDERANIAHLFETDLQGEEFRKACIAAGGDDVNRHILDIVRFACRMGYLDHI